MSKTYDTAACDLCGDANIPVLHDAYCALRGAFMDSKDFSAPVFVLDPDTVLSLVELPNGQSAIITDRNMRKGPTKHFCAECLQALAENAGASRTDTDDD